MNHHFEYFLRKPHRLALLAIVCTALVGCGAPTMDVALVVDPTSSSREGLQTWLDQVTGAVSTGALNGEVAVIVVGPHPKLIGTATSRNAKALRAILKSAATPQKCGPRSECGSDIAGAFEIANDWLGQSGRSSRRLLIAYTDMVADPCRFQDPFRDPLQTKWATGVPIHIFGVRSDQQLAARKEWAGKGAPVLHFPNERFDPNMVGLDHPQF